MVPPLETLSPDAAGLGWRGASGLGLTSTRARQVNTLGELVEGKPEPDGVRGRVGQLPEAVEEAEGVEDGGVDAHAHAGIAGLHALEGGTTGEGAIRDDARGKPATAACVADVYPELLQGTADGGRGTMGRGHSDIFIRR